MPQLHNTPPIKPIQQRRKVLAGLIGQGIQGSRTPAMHQAEGERLGLHYLYQLLDTDQMGPNRPSLEQLLAATQYCGFAGLNITFPYKQQIIPFLDELSDTAKAVGAVNTVVFKDGKRIGHNTDLSGFALSFQEEMGATKRDHVLLIGAGGAGLAVAHALLQSGVTKLFITDVSAKRAHDLAQSLSTQYDAERVVTTVISADLMPHIDGIVNATPVGMSKLPGTPFPLELLEARLWVVDIIYFPLETELLKAARLKACRVASGAGMAVFQAVAAFELITGLKPDAEALRSTFNSLIAS
ncbi:shikimate dehydrogenase [Thiolinea disciformis]|uniref:shikimate dehydrogenase n=1 Tax=Thiolinea disciformis TaxID=125614 RepID=UPI00035D2237|nr:shikimate dehydrogenase [Thiolinea disciformis]